MASVTDILKVLTKYKDLEKIVSGTWDKKKITIITHDVDIHKDRLEVECKFKLDDTEHTVQAKHPWKGDGQPNEIKIDNEDVEQDDVDLDLDTYPFKNKLVLEYRLEYSKDGEKHTLVLRASTKLSSFSPF